MLLVVLGNRDAPLLTHSSVAAATGNKKPETGNWFLFYVLLTLH
jgi:hypothetical protein